MQFIRHARLLFFCLVCIFVLLKSDVALSQTIAAVPGDTSAFTYVSPHPGTIYASAGSAIALRHSEPFDASGIDSSLFSVVGSQSGIHSGEITLSPDAHTIFFKPDSDFAPSEEVRVTVQAALKTRSGADLPGVQWTFMISPKPYPYQSDASSLEMEARTAASASGVAALQSARSAGELSVLATRSMPHYVTTPDLDLHVAITTTGEPLAEGYLFAAPFWSLAPQRGRYSMIFDNTAELVYYRRHSGTVIDYKLQPNGQISYFDPSDASFKVLDNTYQQVGMWRAGNGYVTDVHDFILLPSGHGLLMIYDTQPYDLSAYGGPVTATLTSLIIQEVDQAQNVYFEWNSLDYIPLTDTNQPLTNAYVDYVHGNALELDTDGNILVSSRHLSEITKINRSTGAIIWRLGGKQNQFTFVGDTTLPDVGAFSYQHDIRRLPNGTITLMDNGNDFINAEMRGSRGVEYQLNEQAKTATFVREFRTAPDAVTYYMGNVQYLANSNVLIGWGGGFLAPLSPPTQAITEFTPNGQVALSATYDDTAFVSYRAFRFPWQGYPTTTPTLVAVTNTLPSSIYYSWNGATEVVSYTVSGGVVADALADFAVQPKTGFEEATALDSAPVGACFFRVTPYDNAGQKNRSSNFAYLGDALCPTHLTVSPTENATRTMVLPAATGPATVTLSVGTGAVATTTVFALTPAPLMTSTLPGGKFWAGFSFTLSAYDAAYLAGAPTAAAVQAEPLQLTIDYSALFAPHLATLYLAKWDAGQQAWSTDGVTMLSNDTLRRQLTVSVAGPGTFALLTDNQTRLFFPNIRTQGSNRP